MHCKACDALLPDDVEDPRYELCNKCFGVVVAVLEDELEDELDIVVDEAFDITGATLPTVERDPWD